MSGSHKRDPRRPRKRGRGITQVPPLSRPNHPQRLADRLRHAGWVERRVRGETLTRIAADEGVAVSTVCEALTAYMAEVGQPQALELRALQNERLDLALRAIVPVMIDEARDPVMRMRAADSFLRAHKRFSEVNGCDAPARAPVDDKGNTVGLIDGQDPLALLIGRFNRLAARRDAGEARGGPDTGAGGTDAV